MDEITEDQVRERLRTHYHLTFDMLQGSTSAALGMVRTLIKHVIMLEKSHEGSK